MTDVVRRCDTDPIPPGAGVRDTFVVRIWSSDGDDLVRGHVQHVRSHKRAYFDTREQLLRLIQDQLRDADGTSCPG